MSVLRRKSPTPLRRQSMDACRSGPSYPFERVGQTMCGSCAGPCIRWEPAVPFEFKLMLLMQGFWS